MKNKILTRPKELNEIKKGRKEERKKERKKEKRKKERKR
jgi:hypothetical protein